VDREVSMVGVFEGSNPETTSMVDAMMEYYTA
jgi:hypothetical protein